MPGLIPLEKQPDEEQQGAGADEQHARLDGPRVVGRADGTGGHDVSSVSNSTNARRIPRRLRREPRPAPERRGLAAPAPAAGHVGIDERLDVIGRHPFRARFHLHGRQRAMVQVHGMGAVRGHAADLCARRVAPAQPRKDGK